MKFRNSRPVIAACMGRMIVHSPPKKPAASPEKKLDAASAHYSAVISITSLSGDRLVVSLAAWKVRRVHQRVEKRVEPAAGCQPSSRSARPRQGQRGILAAGDHQMQRRWQVLEQDGDRSCTAWARTRW